MQVKIEKKRTVAVKVDVEMADASKPGPSIQSLINKGLNAKLKQLNLVPGKTKVRYTPSLNSKLWVDNLSLEQADYQSKQELRWQVGRNIFQGSHWWEEKDKCEPQEERWGQVCQEEKWQVKTIKVRQKGYKGQRKGEVVIDSARDTPGLNYIYNLHPASIPDHVLSLSLEDAVLNVHLHTPLDIFEASQYCNSVHCSDGVIVPQDISNNLSLGLNICFLPLQINIWLSKHGMSFNKD